MALKLDPLLFTAVLGIHAPVCRHGRTPTAAVCAQEYLLDVVTLCALVSNTSHSFHLAPFLFLFWPGTL